MKYTVSKCYETWSEEVCEAEATDDMGYVYENQKMSLCDILREIYYNGINCPSVSPPSFRNINKHTWLSTVDGEEDYITGNRTYYSLHIKTSNRQMRRILRLAGIIK